MTRGYYRLYNKQAGWLWTNTPVAVATSVFYALHFPDLSLSLSKDE